MLFITNPRLRKLEAFMEEVPNFPPKGAKVDFDSLEDEILLFEIEMILSISLDTIYSKNFSKF